MPKGIKGFQKGQKFTEKHKKKLSKAISKARIGTHHSVKTRKKLSRMKLGEKNPQWNGGVTPENKRIRKSIEFRLWREAIFARDNWICQKCKNRGGELRPHHIKNFAQFSELRFAIDNGITLCEKCHRKFHKKYGQINNNKKQLEQFLKVQLDN